MRPPIVVQPRSRRFSTVRPTAMEQGEIEKLQGTWVLTETTGMEIPVAYQLTRPNGPECPPEYRGARLTVAL